MPNMEDFQVNYDNLLKLGYAVIDVRYKEYDVCNDSFKLVIGRVDSDRDGFYTEMVKMYTAIDFKPNEIYEIWTEILIHKIKMSQVLNRDIAIKVAALDYIETVYKAR
ncbi:MAG TPA: hypothetical protein PKW22_05470 [Candidatus Syntrophosphaera thermopropionivorans]|jgi:hypothetical protein|nr:hypothetical protein [Candidatus Syntrophosphaera sp.]HOH82851.1 hypothetical protein [Candidatus Syntrophosphaera thermopropionivorans]MBP9006906.1 hypothetical protein [Candidatus Syntrophosphaera sp.]HOJ41401.1 hypothetical protein [Candidatus Syntrophosphaera thermopropionivorans]HOL33223.1 hypothetical protein [Candidatus Syntrophosphaera thermopropionivorans]